MAFTSAQRVSIRHHLGWSGRFLQFDDRLENAMTVAEGNADEKAKILVIVGLCDGLETEVTNKVRLVAQAGAVGSIQLDGARTLGILKSEWKMNIAKLSNRLGVPIRNGGSCGTEGAPDFQTEDSHLRSKDSLPYG